MLSSTKKESILPPTSTGRLQIELTCTYKPNSGSACPKILKKVKEIWSNKATKLGDRPTQYANTPSETRNASSYVDFRPRRLDYAFTTVAKIADTRPIGVVYPHRFRENSGRIVTFLKSQSLTPSLPGTRRPWSARACWPRTLARDARCPYRFRRPSTAN